MNIKEQNIKFVNDLSFKYKWDSVSKNKVKKLLDSYPTPDSLSNKLKSTKDPKIIQDAELIAGLQQLQYIMYIKNTFLLSASINAKIKSIL